MMDPKNDAIKPNGCETAPKDYLVALPKSVKRRVRALKKLQTESIAIEAMFYERVHQLEVEFAPKFDILYSKRKEIVCGTHEPSEEECNYPLLQSCTEAELEELENESMPEPPTPTKGIPGFWLQVFKNVENLAEMIEEHDEPILKHLIDVSCVVESNPDEYTLTFVFEPNEYFENTELKKWYEIKLAPDEKDIFSYDGPTIVSTKGTDIKWKTGKDITRKVIKKKQRRGDGSASRFITKTIKADSFFNFFEPPQADDESEDCQELLQADFEIGQLLRDQIIPRAALFFTGEAMDEFYTDYDESDEEDEDEDEGNGISGSDS